MNAIDKLIVKLQNIPIRSFVVNALNDSENEITDLNKEQLEIGVNSNNIMITPKYRSQRYARYKTQVKGSKAPQGTPNLKLTGSFYRDFYSRANKSVLEIGSTNDKSDELQKKYSNQGNIFGLTNISKGSLREVIFNKIKQPVKNYLKNV